MSHFIPEIHKLDIDESDCLLMTVLIEMSFRRRDVYFELHRTKNRYKLYWCFETFIDEVIAYYKEKNFEGIDKKTSLGDFLNLKAVQDEMKKMTNQSSGYIEKEDEDFLTSFLENGLPALDHKQIPQGLDGHSYSISIKGNQDSFFRSWCVIPHEWYRLKELVELLRKYANLGEEYSVQGMM